MKKITIDFNKQLIILSAGFADMANNPENRTEYLKLQDVKKTYPNFEVVRRSIRKKANKKTWKGFNFQFMETYILLFSKTKEKDLLEFTALKELTKTLGPGARFQFMREWFFAKFPEVENITDFDNSLVLMKAEESFSDSALPEPANN